MEDCIFCKIVNKEVPAEIVYEDDDVIAFLASEPFEKGHTLVIPKKHYKDLLDIPPEELSRVVLVAQKLAKYYEKKLNCGFNLVNNCKRIAEQAIFHFHLHLVPRREKKEFSCSKNLVKYESADEMKKYKELLRYES